MSVDGEKTSVAPEFGETGWDIEETGWWFEETRPAFEHRGDADMSSGWENRECRSTFPSVDTSNMDGGDPLRSRGSWFGETPAACVHCGGWFVHRGAAWTTSEREDVSRRCARMPRGFHSRMLGFTKTTSGATQTTVGST
jgi:hypothetical protein